MPAIKLISGRRNTFSLKKLVNVMAAFLVRQRKQRTISTAIGTDPK
ncbi:MAG TPA: hypothetical protein VM689_04585 [Aliidongia sp.]|nr:hypothetical protein [Aliidongia sp.]